MIALDAYDATARSSYNYWSALAAMTTLWRFYLRFFEVGLAHPFNPFATMKKPPLRSACACCKTND